MHYIYTITNLINYKIYVGQTMKPKHRWSAHKCEAKANRVDYIIYRAMRKHGIDYFHFSILEIVSTQDEADKAESYWIDQFCTRESDYGYNLMPGGLVRIGWHHTIESKKKISDANIGKMQPPHTEEWKKYMSDIMTGRILTEDWKEKISISNTGLTRSEEVRQNIALAKMGTTHNEETKHKMSVAKLGKTKSDETKQRMSVAKRKFSPEQELEIIQLRNSGMKLKDVAIKFNCSEPTIISIMKRNKVIS